MHSKDWQTLLRSLFRGVLAVGLVAILAVSHGCGQQTKANKAESPSTDDDGEQPASVPVKAESRPKSDQELWRGSWTAVTIEYGGKRLAGSGKSVFSEEQSWLNGLPVELHLNPDTSPKRVDGTFAGIYRFDHDDQLTLCLVFDPKQPRPDDFTTSPGDGRQLIVLQRLPALNTASVDAEFERGLRDKILSGIKMLRENRFDDFTREMMSPQQRGVLSPAALSESAAYIKKYRNEHLATFRILLKMEPQLSGRPAVATFDLSRHHMEGGMPFPTAQFIRIRGDWFLLAE